MSCFCLRFPKRIFPSKKACKRFFSTIRRRRRYNATPAAAASNPSLVRCPNPTSVYVDRLYQAGPPVKMEAPTTRSSTSGGGWKEYVESMPEIKGIDERAEEFISNFRQQMRIQRELSLLDYHEMLARST